MITRLAYHTIGETDHLPEPLRAVPNIKEGRSYKRTIESPIKTPLPSKKDERSTHLQPSSSKS